MDTTKLAAMAFTGNLTLFVPLIGMLALRRRGASWKAFFAGAAVFVVFAMALEQLCHAAVLSLFPKASDSLWFSAIYGGLAAGIFEETGRLLAFRYALPNERQPVKAVSYGLGHGGCEAILLTGATMLVNMTILQTAATSPELIDEELAAAVNALNATPAATFLWSGFERLYAMALHVANSVVVARAVSTGDRRPFFIAIAVHALIDFVAVTLNGLLPSFIYAEIACAALTALYAFWVWKTSGGEPAKNTGKK